jgi:outer membrane protein assembly factor BamB
MTPPVLVDVNNDQIEDIIIPLYNSTLFAFDGKTFEQLWNRTFPSSETYRSVVAVILINSIFSSSSSPAVGYFNDDDIPDIMITKLDPGIRCITVLR